MADGDVSSSVRAMKAGAIDFLTKPCEDTDLLAAVELGAAEKTIKVHRGRVMEKLGVESVAELVRLVDQVQDA